MMSYVLFVCYFCAVAVGFPNNEEAKPEVWTGDWFPAAPGKSDKNPIVPESQINLHDEKHGIKMGVPSVTCDDGKTNLTIDWNGSPEDYICFERNKYVPDYNVNPISSCQNIPKAYWAMHACMNITIDYDDIVPTYYGIYNSSGTHRPLWARYGEYKYLPKQRWIHNLEHGAVVMLYHPCANTHQVNILRNIVRNCLYRHVITPYAQLDSERPLALLTWGCRLSMSAVNKDVAESFIKSHALRGPEKVYRDGQFFYNLITPPKFVTDETDRQLCPQSF